MKIAIDISPLKSGHNLWHRVRGTGFYIENLKNALLKFYPNNNYIFFSKGEKLPENVEIVHYPYFEPFFFTLPLIKQYKTIVTVHDLTPLAFPKYFPAGIKGKLKWEIQKMALKNVDAIITDSNCSKNDIIKYAKINPEKINVVYLAASGEFKRIQNSPASPSEAGRTEFKIQNLREKYELPEKFALYVGDVTWNKNLPRLIESVKKIKVPLVMVGKALTQKNFDQTNPWNQDLIKVQKMIEQNNKILRLGFVSTEDLVMLYNIATVFVMPSIYEGFGLPVLEAMQCGCPVVTTKEGSLPEIANEAAFYVDAHNIENIAKGIKEVFSSERLQKKLIEKGLSNSKNFSWQKTAQETIRVYEKQI